MDLDMLLVTNGSMLGHTTVADALVAAQHKVHVRISLDAHSEDTHREQHGIAQVGYWNGLLGSIENLRSRGVAASVSYLVREDSLDELESACAFWHGRLDGGQRRALEFSARIPMDPGGKWLWSAPSKKEVRRTLRKLAGEYKEWFVVPGWLKEWSTDTSESAETPKDPVGPKDVDHCYSAYYRFGISPDHRVAKGDPEHAAGLPTVVAADGVTRLRVTNEAHISFCLFRRYEGPPFGCEYPSHDETFAQWARNKRISVLQQLKPQRDCQGNFCSRVTANRDVQGRVSRS
jgi:molybdenum cofactor biosynthesis enzyme MoaA